MKKAFVRFLLIMNLLAVFALLSSYLAIYISPQTFWPVAFAGLAYPFILVINILFVIFWGVIKPRYLFLSLIFIGLGYSFIGRYFQLRGKSEENKDIKVLSYNVHHFTSDEGRKGITDEIVAFLDEQEADIVCLQEARLWKKKIFNLSGTVKELNNINHYQFARTSKTFGLVTMTRYPIVNMKEIRFEDSNNMTIYTDVIINSDTVRVFNVHLQSFNIHPKNYSVIENMDIQEEKSRRVLMGVASKMRQAFKLRAIQVEKIREIIDASPYPVIVSGDFNDTPVSYAYQTLRGGDLTDAFINSGKGVGRTYVGKMPSFRIDYIMHSPEFESYNFETVRFGQSDHLPVMCDLKIED